MPVNQPYVFGCWYGYDQDCSTVAIFRSGSGQPSQSFICSQGISQQYYHDGSGTYPATNDKVYSNSGGTTPLSAGYYSYGPSPGPFTAGWYRITGTAGIVQTTGLCP